MSWANRRWPRCPHMSSPLWPTQLLPSTEPWALDMGSARMRTGSRIISIYAISFPLPTLFRAHFLRGLGRRARGPGPDKSPVFLCLCFFARREQGSIPTLFLFPCCMRLRAPRPITRSPNNSLPLQPTRFAHRDHGQVRTPRGCSAVCSMCPTARGKRESERE